MELDRVSVEDENGSVSYCSLAEAIPGSDDDASELRDNIEEALTFGNGSYKIRGGSSPAFTIRSPFHGIEAFLQSQEFFTLGTGGGCEAAVKSLDGDLEIWLVENLSYPLNDCTRPVDVVLVTSDPDVWGEEANLIDFSVSDLEEAKEKVSYLIAEAARIVSDRVEDSARNRRDQRDY